MNRISRSLVPRKRVALALAIVTLAALAAYAARSSRGPETASLEDPGPAAETLVPSGLEAARLADSASAARSRVYKDPVTGELGPPPPGVSIGSVQPSRRVGGAAAELTEVPSPVPGGGVLVPLEGRFRSSLEATKDEEGKLTLRHGD